MRTKGIRNRAAALLAACLAQGASAEAWDISGKLLLTGGVASIEGAAGGGLTPWAVIGGNGTRDQVGAQAFYTGVRTQDFGLGVAGVQLGLFDRLELSYAEQKFDTRDVGATLGLGRGFKITQQVAGVKLKLFGDAVLEQDSPWPQVAAGVQVKRNDRGALLDALGADRKDGLDMYVSATKLYLGSSVLANLTLRATKGNQTGILGFGRAGTYMADDVVGVTRDARYRVMAEGSLAFLLRKNLAIGAEFRKKPDGLRIDEGNWYDAFIAFAPSKHTTITLAYVDLGRIALDKRQTGTYLSVQAGF